MKPAGQRLAPQRFFRWLVFFPAAVALTVSATPEPASSRSLAVARTFAVVLAPRAILLRTLVAFLRRVDVVFLADVFFLADFLVADFLVVDFFAVDFFAVDFFAVFFFISFINTQTSEPPHATPKNWA